MMRIGVVSDTHGLWREGVADLLQGCDHLLHAGDVGDPEILGYLGAIAPVTAVRGNVDYDAALRDLPLVAEGQFGKVTWRMTHRRDDIPREWSRDTGLIVFGHSHRPEMEWRSGCLWLNPGAIGPRRFSLPLTLAFLTVRGKRLTPEIVSIED